MDDSLKIALVLVFGYLLGSVTSAYIVGRVVKGVDLRKVGSGTVGASNVYYNVGRFWIVPVGVFDLLVKGLVPIYLARALDLGIGVQVVAGLLVVVGHNWPLFLGFTGGRGVAPAVGVLLALGRLELAFFIVLAATGWRFTKSSAVWVLAGFVALPLAAIYFGKPVEVVLLMVALLLITVVKRLASSSLRGSEIGLLRLLFNRLIYDRDIADHAAWVHRNAPEVSEE